MTISSTADALRAFDWYAHEGTAYPLGVSWVPQERAYNFALYSKHATGVTLLLYAEEDLQTPVVTARLSHLTNKSGRIWHYRLPKADTSNARFYAYRVEGPSTVGHFDLHAFDSEKILLDPYATSVYFPPTFSREAAIQAGSNAGQAPLGVLHEDEVPFSWSDPSRPHHQHDLVIYEMHVRGFTASETSGVPAARRGKFLGVIDKIPYLEDLGVTAVEFMPVHQFDPQEGNYWGYMTLNFFAPHNAYATDPSNAHNEFRQMVNALHQAGIEVILDVVFNHTAEGDHRGPCYSFKGIDNSTYYMTSGNPAVPYTNYSGTGNTLHCGNRYVARMVLDSLRHWVQECHVDGFRFDLASVFARRSDGAVYGSESPIVAAIRADPVLGNVRLIAEPWDASGLYQLGAAFPGKRWMQWNGRFRDDVRRFVRGDPGLVTAIMCRLYGSDDLFPDDLPSAYHPYQSVNYITSHDGFTLYDQVSYNERHNWANGEENRDGHKDNNSWNCGWEGDENLPADVFRLRKRQVKNFFTLLMLANGTPMFCAGDEFLNTQGGNNNPYGQDNEITWLDWRRLQEHEDMHRFFQGLIRFRRSHRSLARSRFWRDDVRWYGTGRDVDMSAESQHLAFCLRGESQGDSNLYVMINAGATPLKFEIQAQGPLPWKRVVDTSCESPEDIYPEGQEPTLDSSHCVLQSRSIVVLIQS